MPTILEQYNEIVEAIGEEEADRLITCEFGRISETYEYLAQVGALSSPLYA